MFIRNTMNRDGGFTRIDGCMSFVYDYPIPYKAIAEITGLSVTGFSSNVSDPSATMAETVSVVAVNAPPAETIISNA